MPISESVERSQSLKAAGVVTVANSRRKVPSASSQFVWVVALLLLVPLADTRPTSIQAVYDHAHQLFLNGDLTRSQLEAEQGYHRFLRSDPEWAAKFQVLEAQNLIWRGMNEDALRVLEGRPISLANKEILIERLSLAGTAYTYLDRVAPANERLLEARALCEPPVYAACGRVPLRRGILALQRGELADARQLFLESLSFARTHRDPRSETSALLNLGVIGLRAERYDDAVDWSWSAYRSAQQLGGEALAENAQGNLGWAYYELGDKDKALEFTLEANQTATKLGSVRNQIKWLANVGLIYQDTGDLQHALQVYQRSLDLAKQINSTEDVLISLEDLTFLSIDEGKLEAANGYIDQLGPLVRGSGNRLDELEVILAQGEIAASRHESEQAEKLFRTVERDPASQTSMRLGAEHQLARLYEAQGNITETEGMYRTALATFEGARAELKNEDSKLPFLANATPVYDDYILFLVKQGKTDEALATADQSRARTLAQGLGVNSNKPSLQPAAWRGTGIARKAGATVLFYWLGEKQSYLWAITPQKTTLFTLPAQSEITPLIERYRKAILGPNGAGNTVRQEGVDLYRMLVEPAAGLIGANSNVVVVSDGPLSLLNFETLIVPAAISGPASAQAPHYWIEDANIVSAPSLYLLASRKPSRSTHGKLLLLGDAVSPNPDYPDLPMAAVEMRQIEKHFGAQDETVFARRSATSGAYLETPLQQYSYIHFVAHGVASRTDPLDSAIILSRTGTAEDSFKLHAREIIQHPIDARLVTISACYGGGTRSYAGEGLVGLSWAFLRAGAHNVIGALWEASDDSTPALMDSLYQGLEEGMNPSAALRHAKLTLMHSQARFNQPFYWAPFQIYTGM
jgi:CHAT domain-containing protein